MFGPGDNPGLIPRAAKQIFDHIADSAEAREWSVRASFLEIYREQLRDLLNPGNQKLAIREQKKKIWVENLSEEYVGAASDVLELLATGEKMRSTASTGMNEQSSRSHSVFILRVESKPTGPGGAPQRQAVLNLIDLAGSERVGKTGAKGTTLEEAKKINQSLSALGNVINALSEGGSQQHIPYRDSQLTRLLQESLGGNCKTRLVVACSPHVFNAEETLSSLRFGQRAKTLKNKVHRNEERSPEELKEMIRALRKELEEWKEYARKLQAQLKQMGASAPDPEPQEAEGLSKMLGSVSMPALPTALAGHGGLASASMPVLNASAAMVDQLTKELDAAQQEVSKAQDALSDAKIQLEQLQEQEVSWKEQMQKAQQSQHDLQRQWEQKESQWIERMQKQDAEWSARHASETEKVESYERELRIVKQSLEDMRTASSSGPSSSGPSAPVEDTSVELNNARRERDQWQGEVAVVEAKLSEARSALSISESGSRALQMRVEQLERQVTERSEELDALTKARDADFVSRADYDQTVRELNELKAWRDSQVQRKARLFRPLKSGGGGEGLGGAKVAMAEKLNFDEFRGKLRSRGDGPKLW